MKRVLIRLVMVVLIVTLSGCGKGKNIVEMTNNLQVTESAKQQATEGLVQQENSSTNTMTEKIEPSGKLLTYEDVRLEQNGDNAILIPVPRRTVSTGIQPS